MSYIKSYIENLNKNNKKALSVFLTSGFPDKENFISIAKNILDAGADMLELGIPFSDPLADGPVIQASSKIALDNGVNINTVLSYAESLAKYTNKPIILMGYANPIKKYGVKNFLNDAGSLGIKGLIVPDVPLEEYDSFFENMNGNLDIILLTTPTSSNERIKSIDNTSKGFVYCVSVTGITGIKNNFDSDSIKNLERSYSIIEKNKMLIGFGISKPENVKEFIPYCDGVIVGSRIIKSFFDKDKLPDTLQIVSKLNEACRF